MMRLLRSSLFPDWQSIGFPVPFLGAFNERVSALPAVRAFSTLHINESKPKRPLNAYLLYLQDERPRLSPASAREIVRAAASKWRILPLSEKQPYLDKYKELQTEYQAAVTSYNSLLSKEEKEAFLQDFRERKLKRHKRSLKKQRKESGIPKRNVTAFGFYLSSRYAAVKVNSASEGAELLKEATNEWKKLFSHQKKPYEDQALADKERYQVEMLAYIEKLRSEGRMELAPLKYQKKVKSEERTQKKSRKRGQRLTSE